MSFNSTCVPGNSTSTSPEHSSSTGLAVGLSVFFAVLVLVIVAGILVYKRFGRLREVLRFDLRKSVVKEDEARGEAPQTVRESHEYSSRPEGNTQAPIYENVTRNNAHDRVASEDDDVYLQCDVIYSNDPGCDPREHEVDDTYIIPDSEDF